jgi:hypothetical protein
MSTDRKRGLLSYLGLVFLILGLAVALYYIPQATQFSTESLILDTLRYVCLGIVLELFGIGLMVFDRK